MKLPTPSRREILTRGAAAVVAGVLLPGLLEGESAPDDAFTFALLSDTHLGRHGETASAQMKTAVEEINAAGAELTIMAGDLVNAGENPANEKRYPEWIAIAGGLKNPWHAIPGNHDPLELFAKHIRPETDYVVDRHPWRFICFRDAHHNPDHYGHIDNPQIDWIQKQIDDAAANRRQSILVTHVPYHDTKPPESGWKITDGRAAFTDLLQRNAKHITALFSGHMHTGLRGWSDTFGIHEVVLPSCCWNFDGRKMKNAPGFAFTEDRPGWVVAELTSKQLKLSYKPVGKEISVIKELVIS